MSRARTIANFGDGLVTADLPALTDAELPAGSVLQVVSTTKRDTFSSTSSTDVDVTGLSVNITPSSSSSKIAVFYSVNFSRSGISRTSLMLFRDTSAIANGTGGSTRNQTFISAGTNSNDSYFAQNVSGSYLDSPGDTSQHTYKIRMFNDGNGTFYVNRRSANTEDGMVSTITVMEIAG